MFEHPNRREVLQSMAATLAIPLQRGPGGSMLRATAFGPDGRPAGPRQMDSLLLIDLAGRPFESQPKQGGDGACTIALPDRAFQLMMRLPVRGFGEVYLYADGVRGPEALLNYEFARSRAAFVRRYVTAAELEGVGFSAGLRRRLEAGEAAVQQAAAATAMSARVQHSNDSLAETMWAGEMAAIERAQHRIGRNRPRPGFLLGCNLFGFAGSETYRQQYGAVFNFGTVPFYRNNTERTEGVLDYSRVDAILERALGTPLLLKGHPLLWFKRQNMPEFLLKKSWPDVKASSREYVLNCVGRYRSRIHSWDVINEAHDWANEFHYEPGQMVEITALMSQAAREADPRRSGSSTTAVSGRSMRPRG